MTDSNSKWDRYFSNRQTVIPPELRTDPNMTPIERSLHLAQARADAYARDPDKYEEMIHDAKQYPEGADDEE